MVPKKLNTVYQNFRYNIKLKGVTRAYFNKSEWERNDIADKVSWKYLTYRAAFCSYFIIWLIVNVSRSKHPNLFLLYATNWSFIVQTIYGLIYFANLLHRFILYRRYENERQNRTMESVRSDQLDFSPRRKSPTHLNICDSAVWLLVNVVGTVPYIVSVGYWALIYKANSDNSEAGDVLLNMTSHGFNAILALVETFVNAIPIRMAHGLYTLVFTLVYILFSLFYELAGGVYKSSEKPYIYSFLNWREEPGKTVGMAFVAIFASLLLHFCLWSIFRFKSYLVLKFNVKGPSNIYIVHT